MLMPKATQRRTGPRALAAVAALGCAAVIVLFSARASAQQQPAGNAAQVISPLAVIHSVADLDRSVAFYRDVVGLTVAAAPAFPSDGKRLDALLGLRGAHVRAVTLAVPGSELHLVLAQFSGVQQRKIVERIQDPGVVKLVLQVRDIDKAFATARPHLQGVFSTGGAPVYPEGPQQRVRAVVMQDPDGLAFEFVLANEDVRTTAAPSSNVVGGWASLINEDEDRALAFYEKLGFVVRGKRLLSPSVLALEGTPAASVTIAPTRPPGTSFTWFLYDFRQIERQPLHAGLADLNGSGISFVVADLSTALRALQAAGGQLVSARPVHWSPDTAAVVLQDPSGIPIELVQRGAHTP